MDTNTHTCTKNVHTNTNKQTFLCTNSWIKLKQIQVNTPRQNKYINTHDHTQTIKHTKTHQAQLLSIEAKLKTLTHKQTHIST